jgi:N-acetylglucosaminyldiphosphoundecaprenol N-acetyl-beta-D-mannosaminyltransferase
MTDAGKKNILGVLVNALDYETAVQRIISAACERRGFGAAALAVHGVVLGWRDKIQRHRLNQLDVVTPDGQPLRWFLNFAYSARLADRVYGPTLMLKVCEAAARERLPVFLYGSSAAVTRALARNLGSKFPGLEIAGAEPGRFRVLDPEERTALVARIRQSGARIVFVGLGCPRQEIFVYELREALGMPLIAVGAAFDYHSGFKQEPPAWMQRAGLQWLHRLAHDPRRLWRRYLVFNSIFAATILLQLAGLLHPDSTDTTPPEHDLLPG